MSDRGEQTLKLVTAPTIEPVTLEEVKSDLRLTDISDNDYISAAIVAARQAVERYLNRALIEQTWDLIMDVAPRRFAIPYPPLISVEKISSYDEQNVETVNNSDNYIVNLLTDPGYVSLKSGNSWVDHRDDLSFQVRFKAGYGDTAAEVPGHIRRGIRVLTVKLYERRGDDINLLLMDKDVTGWLMAYKAFL